MQLKKIKVEVGLKFEIVFLTQHLGLSIFYPNLSSNNPALFRVYKSHLYFFYKQILLFLLYTFENKNRSISLSIYNVWLSISLSSLKKMLGCLNQIWVKYGQTQMLG